MRDYLIRLTPARGREDGAKRISAAGYERKGAWFEFYGESPEGKREILDSYRAFDVAWIEAVQHDRDVEWRERGGAEKNDRDSPRSELPHVCLTASRG